VAKLSPFADVSLIEKYAARFGQDPNWVCDNIDFNTIIMFNEKWLKEEEYQERYNEIEQMMSNSKQ
jgi:hypothetical protein